jgi:hypothetical protein
MFRILLLAISCLIAISSQAQYANQGTLDIDLSVGLGMYHGYENIRPEAELNKVNAAATVLHFDVNYFAQDRISVGAQFRGLRYITEDDSTAVINAASSNGILLHGDYHFSNRPKFNAYLGFGLGVNGFVYDRMITDTNNVTTRGTIRAAGSIIDLRSGLRWCFSKHFGFHLSANYSVYPMQVIWAKVNGNKIDELDYVPVEDVIINFRGVELIAGFSIYF